MTLITIISLRTQAVMTDVDGGVSAFFPREKYFPHGEP